MSASVRQDAEHQQLSHQQAGYQHESSNSNNHHPPRGQRGRRMGGGAGQNPGPTLPLLSGPPNPVELFLDAHPDGSRTAPHRSWHGNRGSGMYSGQHHPVVGGYGDQRGGGSGWTGGGKGLMQQQGGSFSSSYTGGGHQSSGAGGGIRRSLGPRASNNKGGGSGPSPTSSTSSNSPPTSLGLIRSVTGDNIQFTETNMDWTKLNIFRTRLCDRLTQMHSCHMANRCLFSHDIAWPRRTPFLPRATALTLRYIPVWCPRVPWPPLSGVCDSLGKISWSASTENYDPSYAHNCCIRGDNCPFVHNLEEFLYHPEIYKTRMCCLANDDANIGDDMNGNCLCPWYFCPFAHYLYELRDVRQARHAWHPPPQIIDNHFVARTQGFDEVELMVIQYVRKSTNGSIDLYLRGNSGSMLSPIRELLFGPYLLAPVFRPISGSSLERLIASDWHRQIEFDDLLYLLVMASLLNLVLYPVENFYVPALLSLQNAAIEYQLNVPKLQIRDTSELLDLYDQIAAPGGSAAAAILMSHTTPTSASTNHGPDTDTWGPSAVVKKDSALEASQPPPPPNSDATSPTNSNLGSARGSQHHHQQSQLRPPSPLLPVEQISPAVSLPPAFSNLTPGASTTGGSSATGQRPPSAGSSMIFNTQASSSPTSSSWGGGGSDHTANSPHSLPRFFNSSGRYDHIAASAGTTASGGKPSGGATSPTATNNSNTSDSLTTPAKLTCTPEVELETFLESLCPEDLLKVVELFTNDQSGNMIPNAGTRKKSWGSSADDATTNADTFPGGQQQVSERKQESEEGGTRDVVSLPTAAVE